MFDNDELESARKVPPLVWVIGSGFLALSVTAGLGGDGLVPIVVGAVVALLVSSYFKSKSRR